MGSRLCLRRVLVTRQMTAHSLKMNGLLLASYRANSTPCSLTTCVATAACAYTSPQPTDCSGPWVLESAWDHSQASTAYPWLREPRPRACEHPTRVGRWQGRTKRPSSQSRDGRTTPRPSCELQQCLVHDGARPIHENKPQPLMPAYNQMRFGDTSVGAV